jgi:hypothetical protein
LLARRCFLVVVGVEEEGEDLFELVQFRILLNEGQ